VGQQAFHNFQCVPPDTGIVHQVNLDFSRRSHDAKGQAIPTPWSAPIRTPR